MLISDKYALYRFLNSYVASNGATLFLRTGSSDTVPQKLQDLAASSVAAVSIAYRAQTSGSDALLRRTYGRARSLQPIGGYGQRRTYTVSSQQVLAYHVVPETVLIENTSTVQTPAQYAQRAGIFGDYGATMTGLQVAGQTTLDFGRTLRFRGITVFSTSNFSTSVLYYLAADGVTWTQAVPSLSNGEYQFDFTARKVRIVGASTINGTASVMLWAERGTEFSVRPITHGVLVPELAATSYAGLIDTTKMDYLSLILDVGTDLKLDTVQTGKFGHVAVQDWSIPIKAAVRQGA